LSLFALVFIALPNETFAQFTEVDISDYVQNGLVLHYDGINNTGTGHNNEASFRKDLTSNNNSGTLKSGLATGGQE
jgi:hypothetical protein